MINRVFGLHAERGIVPIPHRQTAANMREADAGGARFGGGVRFVFILDIDRNARAVAACRDTGRRLLPPAGDAVFERILNQRLQDQRRNRAIFAPGLDGFFDFQAIPKRTRSTAR